MRCGTSFFNRTVYFHCLKRHWPVWASLLLVWSMLLPIPLLNIDAWTAVWHIRSFGSFGGLALLFGFAALAAVTVFSWMYQPRSVGFMAALPLRREGMFLSCWLAGFTMLAAPAVLTALLTLLASLYTNAAVGHALLVWLGQMLLCALCFFGFASLCAQLTGALWILPVVYGVLNVAVVCLWFLIAYVLELMLPGYRMNVPEGAAALSPVVQLFTYEWTCDPFRSWLGLGLYAVFGLVSTGLALLLARRRRMESATDTVALAWLKPVFRWCAGVALALGLGTLLYLLTVGEDKGHYIPMALFLIVGGFIGWIAAEMLMRKSYRVGSSLKTFPILAALLVLFMAFCACGGLGYVNYVPAADAVASAGFDYGSWAGETADPAEIELICGVHRDLIAQKRGGWPSISIAYQLKNGRIVNREYEVGPLDEAWQEPLREILERTKREELRSLANDPHFYFYGDLYGSEIGTVTLDDQEMRRLLREGILPDVEAGRLRLVSDWLFSPTAEDAAERWSLSIRCWPAEAVTDDGYRSASYFTVSITDGAASSLAVLDGFDLKDREYEYWDRYPD